MGTRIIKTGEQARREKKEQEDWENNVHCPECAVKIDLTSKPLLVIQEIKNCGFLGLKTKKRNYITCYCDCGCVFEADK